MGDWGSAEMTVSNLNASVAPESRRGWTPTAGENSAATPTDLERVRRRLLRLAFDVHDGPLQSLAAAGFGLSDLQERLAALPVEPHQREPLAEMLADIVAELAESERTLRSLVSTLEDARPEIPLAKDILDAELERFRRRCPVPVSMEGDWLFHPDSRSQALTLEALLRESLTNIAKHASANAVYVRLARSDTHALLEIQDDGLGFQGDLTNLATIGLAGMRERVRLLSGHFEILSKPGGPTLVTAILPRWYRRRPGAAYTEPPVSARVATTT